MTRLIAADFSAIEGRVTAWLAGEEAELDAYRQADAGQGAGIYEIAAGAIFDKPAERVTKPERQVGKVACIAEGTLVLALDFAGQTTYKPIQDVDASDKVWDGEEWVSHAGVVCTGVRECVTLSGMRLTPDHLVWCGPSTGWTPAEEVGSDDRLTRLALVTATGSLSSQVTSSETEGASENSSFSATAADPSTGFQRTTFATRKSSAATPARNPRPTRRDRSSTFTTQGLVRIWRSAVDCLTASLQRTLAATARTPSSTPATAGEGFAYTGRRSTATNRWESKAGAASSRHESGGTRCWPTWSLSQGRATRASNWTGSTTTQGTRPGICASSAARKTHSTSGRSTFSPPGSGNSRQSWKVYDLVNAGPRNRFTISSSEGALIVHNCLALGFQGGVVAFHSMALVYRVDMANAYAPLLATTDAETWQRAERRYEECLERGDTGTDVMTDRAWIASEVTKVLWRRKHPATVALWKGLEEAAFDAVARPGMTFGYGRCEYLVARGFLWCRLPSGRVLAYGGPKIQDRKTPWGDTKAVVTALGVDSVTKQWRRFALYGGLATENCVQAVARDLLAHGMLVAERHGYPIVLHVHDEAVAEVPDGFGSLAEFEQLLCDRPAWAEGLPYLASGYEGKRFRKD